MSEELRPFLQGTASIFHESTERCGSVDAAAGVIRLGMKKLEFPIWVLKSILAEESLQTDAVVITDVIDKYLGIANIRNYGQNATESDLANEIGRLMREYPDLVPDLESLFVSQKCREGMKVYLDEYRGGELPALAITIKDNGNYISEVKKKFNADEANWVWSPNTANVKIDETIIEYSIITESNTMIAPAATLTGCVRNWKDHIENFRISLEAMATEVSDLKELLDILYTIRQNRDNTIPDMKKKRFLELLREKKNDFNYLYGHQEEMFRRIAQGWISELSDEDVTELFGTYMATGVFCDASDKFFQSVEAQVNAYTNAQRSKRLRKLWHDRTETQTPADWSQQYSTPILCMFDDNERQKAKEVFTILHKSKPSEKDYCDQATIKRKDILWYLSDETEEERAALIHALCSYSYTPDELNQVLAVVSPQLATYLKQFIFDEFNTKVMESDAYVRELLTDYFQRYKFQKLTNHQDADFVELVEKEAKTRSFMKLQARSAIVKKLDKKGVRPYFFDALGVEFLAFIESRAEVYKMQFECFVGHCNLPSITSKNKEFYDAFPEGSIRKEEGLDELKHQGTKYDFQFTTEPLHIFDELALLDRDLKKWAPYLLWKNVRELSSFLIMAQAASR